MSRYEWERGEFTIPSAEWAGFKAKIRDEMNELHVRQFDIAKKLYDRLIVLAKGSKNFDINFHGFEEIEKLRLPESHWAVNANRNLTRQDELTVVWALSVYCPKTKRDRLVRPTQKMFPKLGNNVTEFTNSNCSVTFDNTAKKVYWEVPENNHACDDARDTALGKVLFKALDGVKWTRGSGGRIWGSDEYRDEANRDHGFGDSSFEKKSWGPKEANSLTGTAQINRVYNISNTFKR